MGGKDKKKDSGGPPAINEETCHAMVGQEMMKSKIISVKESRHDANDRFIKVKREITLENGCVLQQQEFLSKEQIEEEEKARQEEMERRRKEVQKEKERMEREEEKEKQRLAAAAAAAEEEEKEKKEREKRASLKKTTKKTTRKSTTASDVEEDLSSSMSLLDLPGSGSGGGSTSSKKKKTTTTEGGGGEVTSPKRKSVKKVTSSSSSSRKSSHHHHSSKHEDSISKLDALDESSASLSAAALGASTSKLENKKRTSVKKSLNASSPTLSTTEPLTKSSYKKGTSKKTSSSRKSLSGDETTDHHNNNASSVSLDMADLPEDQEAEFHQHHNNNNKKAAVLAAHLPAAIPPIPASTAATDADPDVKPNTWISATTGKRKSVLDGNASASSLGGSRTSMTSDDMELTTTVNTTTNKKDEDDPIVLQMSDEDLDFNNDNNNNDTKNTTTKQPIVTTNDVGPERSVPIAFDSSDDEPPRRSSSKSRRGKSKEKKKHHHRHSSSDEIEDINNNSSQKVHHSKKTGGLKKSKKKDEPVVVESSGTTTSTVEKKKHSKKKDGAGGSKKQQQLSPPKPPKAPITKKAVFKPPAESLIVEPPPQTFDKIMGVWGAREQKSTYATPIGTIKSDPLSIFSDIGTPPLAMEDIVKRHGLKAKNEQPTESNEAQPSKLRNVWADKLKDRISAADGGITFEPPVFKKTDAEKKFLTKSFEKDFAFSDLAADEIGPLVDAFERVEYGKGASIATAGDVECRYSIVQTGEVSFHARGAKVGKAGPGEAFGELALLYSCPRTTDVRAEDHQTVLFQIDQTNFREVMRENMHRSEEEKTKLLRSVPIFKDVDESDLKQLSAAMIPHNFKKGENLSNTFKDAPFCLVQQGTVVATDATIGPGESFGEKTLTKQKETPKFDVAATSDGTVFTIDRESFDRVFGDFSRLSRKYGDKRTLANIKAIKVAQLNEQELDLLVRQITETKFEEGHVIFIRDDKMVPALYLVRKGEVQIVKKNGKEETIGPGGYFAQEYLMFNSKGSRDTVPKYAIAKYSAAAIEDTECGVLTLADLATVTGRVNTKPDLEGTTVELEDLNRHRILGEGQFGTVWLVTDKNAKNPEPYALKIQYTDDGERADAADCIRREVKMMQALQHHFIIEVINTYEEATQISMLLSLAPGGELFDIIHHQDETGGWVSGLGEEQGRFYAAVVADTLAYMHRQKYVYRDLKPENVLIDKDGYPMITDFGFVKKVEDKTFTFCGTPNYVAPEVVSARGHGVSCDNWSLGVLIYELIDGENPFWTEGMDQETLYELIRKALYYPLPDNVSREARDLVGRLLEKDPSKRLGTFREKDILEHKWFSKYNLKQLREKQVKAPWIPNPISLEAKEEEDE